MAGLAAFALGAGLAQAVVLVPAQAAPVGQGFNLNASDLAFMLKQIKIAERHAATVTPENPCGTLLGNAPDQIPNVGQGVELPWGLRTVDGSCNNLIEGQNDFGGADQPFPRLVPKKFRAAENGTDYAVTGNVTDSEPRVVSNLIVDQTAGNPAAVEAAGESPVVTPSGAFEIPNVATDVGLSAPYNSWFTLFGQFFDHGLDLVKKGGAGTVFIPLQPDDPLYTPGAPTNFMVVTRATHGGDKEALNETNPFVDQSQTYGSHPSHQVFLREYANDATGKPQSTGGLITRAGGGMADWATVKVQAAALLGIELRDANAQSVPLMATDPYGRFIPGPNGFPQMVTTGGVLVEGNPAAPISTVDAVPSGQAFLVDIAHNAVPKPGFAADGDTIISPALTPCEFPGFPTGCVNEYDDEMLDAHFIAGDGRVNENIGLTSVHHVFHSEHNRLVDESDEVGGVQEDPSDIKSVIRDYVANAPANNPLFTLADWQRADGEWDGERLFQAARFVTEMEYQHLAFEEFARKVQPGVNPFGEGGTGYDTTINPAIRAEFAHAVYRFGHSMLTESVDRVDAAGTRSDMPLLTAFLNPPAFQPAGKTPDEAAGDIVRGMTRQVGNELDEFVTEALRNQLLGLPLDLATINMARARETGVPTLNEARRSFYAATSSSALTPYESWADLSFNLKNSASLANFIAAYGTHDTITSATTAAGKRAAAESLLSGPGGPDGILEDDPTTAGVDESADNAPEDAYAFLNGTAHETTDPATGEPVVVHTRWVSDANGVTTTGVDDIDLWVGGLAEKQMVFGGLLGPTFNYVFEAQMEDLQNGDRFYYLSRTAGLNLLTQLEGNSFAELIHRNTDVSGLPADSFARPDLIFNLANLGTSGPILNDPGTPYDESTLLTRMANGTIRYGGDLHVVFNGTSGNNRAWSSEGDDTMRGNDGNDWLEGGDGADNLIGGLGDDTLLDLFGDDVLKGGDGNDTLSSGQGFGGDLNQGGRGNDFILGGNDATESFAGPGDDYVYAGEGDDTVFGDDGNDWIEAGGGAFNLLQGDNGAPFQDDPNEPGDDVLIGYGGETDYDAEGGNDIMLSGPGIQRSEGMLGFDWATHKGDPAAADSDMDFTGLLPPGVETNRDRFDLVEALSGWNRDDVLRGDSRNAVDIVAPGDTPIGAGHALDQAGIDRVDGLAGVLPAGTTGFAEGNILLGGAGSDIIEGRGGDDIIDGDAYLNVRISVRDAAAPATEIDSEETMAGVRARVLNGTVKPGQLRVVREILTPANGTSVDTAQFSGARAEYDVTLSGDRVVVAHTGGTQVDGVDTLRNVETLQFADGPVPAPVANVAAAGTPTLSSTSPQVGVALIASTAGITDGNGLAGATFAFQWQAGSGTTFSDVVGGTAAAFTPTSAQVGQQLRVVVSFTDDAGNAEQVTSAATAAVAAAAAGPTVTSTSPADGATDVAPGSSVLATFSETVTRFGGGNVSLTNAAGDPVPVTIGFNRNTNRLNINPFGTGVGTLELGTTYQVTLTGGPTGIRSLSGVPLETTSWTFTTPDPASVPTVTSTNPADGAINVAPGSSVLAFFSETVTGFGGGNVSLTNAAGDPVPVTIGFNRNTNRLNINPFGTGAGTLALGTTYQVTLTGGPTGIRDLGGVPMETTSFTFTTSATG